MILLLEVILYFIRNKFRPINVIDNDNIKFNIFLKKINMKATSMVILLTVISITSVQTAFSGDSSGTGSILNWKQRKIAAGDTITQNPKYDSLLAKKLGADDYGMKSYILVILKTGPNQTTDKTFINDKFKGHLDNMNRMVEEGKLIVAGPLGKNNKTYRGIFILNVTKFEEAEILLKTDPAIDSGLLEAELYNWYGSAALPEYLKYSDKIWKSKP
jgi:uncharacterized protein YciI